MLDRDAIATRLERAYDQSFANACEDYVGPECDCDFAPLVPRCVESKCRAVQSPEPNRYALERRGANVVVTPVYRSCAQDSDCTLVATSCAGCCERDAITAALESTYDENLTPACADYRGGICDCSVLPAKARCIDDVCTHVPTN